ncbi:unnamed protein product, partial [Discosporangium mesarthrocarpum]
RGVVLEDIPLVHASHVLGQKPVTEESQSETQSQQEPGETGHSLRGRQRQGGSGMELQGQDGGDSGSREGNGCSGQPPDDLLSMPSHKAAMQEFPRTGKLDQHLLHPSSPASLDGHSEKSWSAPLLPGTAPSFQGPLPLSASPLGLGASTPSPHPHLLTPAEVESGTSVMALQTQTTPPLEALGQEGTGRAVFLGPSDFRGHSQAGAGEGAGAATRAAMGAAMEAAAGAATGAATGAGLITGQSAAGGKEQGHVIDGSRANGGTTEADENNSSCSRPGFINDPSIGKGSSGKACQAEKKNSPPPSTPGPSTKTAVAVPAPDLVAGTCPGTGDRAGAEAGDGDGTLRTPRSEMTAPPGPVRSEGQLVRGDVGGGGYDFLDQFSQGRRDLLRRGGVAEGSGSSTLAADLARELLAGRASGDGGGGGEGGPSSWVKTGANDASAELYGAGKAFS